jgi:organic radical activating enzyme
MHNSDLEFKQQVLDTKSASFCGAKWYNATIWLGSGMSTSCHHPPAHLVDIEEVKRNPKALHNTPQKKQDRRQMQAGERPPGCEYCWKIEDIKRDNISDRVYKSKIYTIKDLDDAFNRPTEDDVNLRTLEISFDRTCQFSCSYCNPAFSSTWVKDIKSNGPYVGLVSDGRNHFTHAHDSAQLFKYGETNPYIEAFFKWWETDLHKTLDELRITGGEPLMSGHTWQLLDWFKQNKGKSNTRLAINSNLGKDVDVDRLFDSVDQPIDLYTSNESWDAQSEYIRDGLEWQLWIDNINKILQVHRHKLRGLHIMCTINALCLESLTEFLDLLVALKTVHGKNIINFTLNILRFPSFQSALVFPDDIRNRHKERLRAWLNYQQERPLGQYLQEHEVNHIIRLIDYLDVVKTPHSDTFDMPKLHNDFKKFYTQYDERRNKNFTTTFPELADWYNTL